MVTVVLLLSVSDNNDQHTGYRAESRYWSITKSRRAQKKKEIRKETEKHINILIQVAFQFINIRQQVKRIYVNNNILKSKELPIVAVSKRKYRKFIIEQFSQNQ